MIDYVPVTKYELRFPKGEPMPLYIYYTLLGQEYEILREEPHFLKRPEFPSPQYVLDTLRTALNGYPTQEYVTKDNTNTRVFNVRFGDEDETKLVEVYFRIDAEEDILECTISRGHYKDGDTSHIEYEPCYALRWTWDDLDFYGLLNYNEEEFDD